MNKLSPVVPIVGLVGSSGSGKTTLLERMLPVLGRAGWRVGVVKHAGRGFDLEEHGKDSHRVREAGAAQVLVARGSTRRRSISSSWRGSHTRLTQRSKCIGRPTGHDVARLDLNRPEAVAAFVTELVTAAGSGCWASPYAPE